MVGKKGKEGKKEKRREGYMCGGEKKRGKEEEEGNMDEKKSKEIREK